MKELLTRRDARETGLDYSSEQFRRWEKDGLLHPIKVGDRRSARVHYARSEIEALIGKRQRPHQNS